MTKVRSQHVVWLLLLLAISVIPFACGPRRSANEKRYPIKGKIIAVDQTDRTATISHEDIVGYMPAMTMPRFPSMIAASASARRAVGVPACCAAARIGLSSLIAEE